MRFVVAAICIGLCLVNYARSDNTEQIEQRIQPMGKVHVQEEEKPQVDKRLEVRSTPGQKIYERFCVVCHRDGLVGAPKFHDEQAWKSRLSGKTLNELVSSAVKGLNAMPAKGTCFECTEDDIKSAIEYMLPNHD